MHQKIWSYDLWLQIYGFEKETDYFGSNVCLFYPPGAFKNWNLKKIKKGTRDMILHQFNKNCDHILAYDYDKHTGLSCDNFCPSKPPKGS